MWLIATICLVIFASILSLWARMEGRKEKNRLETGELSAEDFEILEE